MGRSVLCDSQVHSAILIAHEISGAEPERELQDPPILLLVITIGFAIPFAAFGGWLRLREERKGAVESAREMPGPLG